MTFTRFKKKETKQEGKTLPETGESTAAFQAKDEAQDEAPAKNANILTAESEKEISEPSSSTKQETVQTGSVESSGFLKRLKNGLSKTRKLLSTDINELFTGKRKIDDELLEELEELLITALAPLLQMRGKPVVVSMIGRKAQYETLAARFEEMKVPTYPLVSRPAKSLVALYQYAMVKLGNGDQTN